MKDNKDFDREKLDVDEIRVEESNSNPFLAKLSNFWYYHKWKVIIGAFFAVVIGVGVFQMFNREEVDEIVIVAAPVYLSAEEREALDRLITSQLPKNKDGSLRDMDVYDYVVYSEDEIDEINKTAETAEEGDDVPYVDRSFNVSEIKSYNDFLSTGECSVLFLSEYLYGELAMRDSTESGDVRLTMAEIFGDELPEGVMPDGCGIRLGDTEIYKYYEALQVLPEDTVICVLRSYFYGASSNKEKHAMSVELFKNIVTFGSEN